MIEQVENLTLESVLDDSAQAPENTGTLDSIAEEVPAAKTEPEEAPAKEPGWIKQRVSKAVDRAVREAEQRVRAEYEAMLAPIREDVMDRQAKELVASGEFKSLDRAKEYVRLKNGNVAPSTEEEPKEQPQRDSQGRFTAKQQDNAPNDAMTRARSELLAAQAHKINTTRGVDVMQIFNSDPEVQKRVLSGEWDFYDVAENAAAPRNSAPAMMRSSNGSGTQSGVSIANMTDEQFRRLQENLSHGRRYDVSK